MIDEIELLEMILAFDISIFSIFIEYSYFKLPVTSIKADKEEIISLSLN